MKKKLSQDYDFYEQFYIVQITSRLPDFQLAWSLNKNIKTDFRKLEDFKVYFPKKSEYLPYSLYGWSSSNIIEYYLVTSLEKMTSLMSETFLLVEKKEQKETVERFIEKTSVFEFIFSIEEITFNTPASTPKQRQLLEQLNNIAIDIEPHIDKLKKVKNIKNIL